MQRLIFLLLIIPSLSSGQPSTWLSKYVDCRASLIEFTGKPPVHLDEAVVKRGIQVIPGKYSGQAGVWVTKNGMARFAPYPSVTPGGMLSLYKERRVKRIKINIANEPPLFVTFSSEINPEVQNPNFLVVTNSKPFLSSSTNVTATNPMLDKAVRQDFEANLRAHLRALRRVNYPRRFLDPKRGKGRQFTVTEDVEGKTILREVENSPSDSPDSFDFHSLNDSTDALVDYRNKTVQEAIDSCIKNLTTLQDKPEAILDLLRQKRKELLIPQIERESDGSRDEPTAI